MNDLSCCGTQSAYISVINRRGYRFCAFPCARDPTRQGLPFQDPLDMRSRHIRLEEVACPARAERRRNTSPRSRLNRGDSGNCCPR